jgi:predicted kinase
VTARPRVILIAGPAGVGKTSIAARIARHPHWEHISEDDYWVKMKAGQPPGELRTDEEELVVQTQVMERIDGLLRAGRNVTLEFILHKDPPAPVLNYRRALTARGVAFETRLLHAGMDEVLQRMAARGRPNDSDVDALRRSAKQQLRCLASAHIDPANVIDTSGVPVEAPYARHFRGMVED